MSDMQLPETVDRWEASGGTWRLSDVRRESATVELLRCDGGEVVDRLTLHSAEDLAWAQRQTIGREAGDTA